MPSQVSKPLGAGPQEPVADSQKGQEPAAEELSAGSQKNQLSPAADSPKDQLPPAERPESGMESRETENPQPNPVEPENVRQDFEQIDLFENKLLSREASHEHRIIGQVFDTYWLVEYRDSLYFIDQHAAHEKVLYEKTMASLTKREYTSQMVSPPIILTLTPAEETLLREHKQDFEAIGFEIEPFGGKEYAVSAVPDNLFSIAKKELLMEMLDSLSGDAGLKGSEMILEKVASMSCKAAVKGGNRLTLQEADKLIEEQLMELDNPYNCPHGRPTIVSMSRREIEKYFKRIL